MGNTFSQIYIHLIFSTKHRAPIIKPEFEEDLKSYIFNSAKSHDLKVLAINGTRNHLHGLLIIPTRFQISEAARIIKGGSSRWINDNYFGDEKFRWQRGYGAFSINKSLVPKTKRYIHNQKEHHQKTSYEEEFTSILDKHDIEYDRKKLFSSSEDET